MLQLETDRFAVTLFRIFAIGGFLCPLEPTISGRVLNNYNLESMSRVAEG